MRRVTRRGLGASGGCKGSWGVLMSSVGFGFGLRGFGSWGLRGSEAESTRLETRGGPTPGPWSNSAANKHNNKMKETT